MHKKCIPLPHSYTLRKQQLNLEYSFTASLPLHLRGEAYPLGNRVIDGVVRLLMAESLSRCDPEASLPPAHWTVCKWCNYCVAWLETPGPGWVRCLMALSSSVSLIMTLMELQWCKERSLSGGGRYGKCVIEFTSNRWGSELIMIDVSRKPQNSSTIFVS